MLWSIHWASRTPWRNDWSHKNIFRQSLVKIAFGNFTPYPHFCLGNQLTHIYLLKIKCLIQKTSLYRRIPHPTPETSEIQGLACIKSKFKKCQIAEVYSHDQINMTECIWPKFCVFLNLWQRPTLSCEYDRNYFLQPNAYTSCVLGYTPIFCIPLSMSWVSHFWMTRYLSKGTLNKPESHKCL